MSKGSPSANVRVVAVGDNAALMWGLTARERLRRIAETHGLELADAAGEGSSIIVDLAYAFDPAWFRFIVKHPDHVVTRESRPFLAHCTSLEQIDPISDAMRANAPLPPLDDVTVFPQEDGELLNPDLRKRERAFAEQLTPQSAHALE
ncbi:MAG: CDP-alcohol phosphatidyltransferase family protein, partial [Sphingomonadaceae bacterium]